MATLSVFSRPACTISTPIATFSAFTRVRRSFGKETGISRSRASISSYSAPADRRKPRNSTKNRLRTISTAGAACGPRIPRKPTLIGLKLIRWAAGTLRVGIGIPISAVTPTFREAESSTARSAGVSIRPFSLVRLHLATMAISTIISIPTGIAGAEVTVIITLLTTITASIMALAAMDIAASIMEQMAARTAAWATAVASTMVAGGFMAVEGLIVVEGFMAEAVAIKT